MRYPLSNVVNTHTCVVIERTGLSRWWTFVREPTSPSKLSPNLRCRTAWSRSGVSRCVSRARIARRRVTNSCITRAKHVRRKRKWNVSSTITCAARITVFGWRYVKCKVNMRFFYYTPETITSLSDLIPGIWVIQVQLHV